jgi:hypothetical protein
VDVAFAPLIFSLHTYDAVSAAAVSKIGDSFAKPRPTELFLSVLEIEHFNGKS